MTACCPLCLAHIQFELPCVAPGTVADAALLRQVEELQAALALEQSAHQHAVKQYVDALDAKSAMQLQLQDAQQQLQELAGVHERLQQQHQELNDHYGTLLGQCKAVRLCNIWRTCTAWHCQ